MSSTGRMAFSGKAAAALSVALVSAVFSLAARAARPHHPAAQATATTNPGRVMGAIASLSGSTMEVKTDQGISYSVTIPASVKLLRVDAGATTLGNAQTISVSDLGVGDRVLVRLAAGDTCPFAASSVIDIPHAAIVARQRAEQMEWQAHGVSGLVKSVDATSGTIVLTTGAGKMAKEVTLKVTPTTVLKRYAADSVDYAKATAAPMAAIHAGDQLRARFDAKAGGADKTALEVVSGSFRNIAGRISNVNAKDGTITLRDLLTKKNVTVHIGATSQMKQLTADQAKMIAALTKGPVAGGQTAGGQAGAHGAGQSGMRPQTGGRAMGNGPMGAPAMAGAPQGGGGWRRPGGSTGMGAAHGDPQQIVRQATVIELKDLRKGDAVMLVGTAGEEQVTAITLLAGVEPLLESSASEQNALMANWSMSSGGDQSDSSQ